MLRELPPIESVIYAAEKLGDLREHVMFLGGAVVGLLITDTGARPPRATKDVDVAIEIGTLNELYALDEKLLSKGFRNDVYGPTCRYEHGPIRLDVMPINGDVLGFTNRWYSSAIQAAEPYSFEGGLSIKLISAPSFLATKMEAFSDPNREGHADIVMSRDFGDVVRVVDGRASIVEEVSVASPDLQEFLKEQFRWTLKEPYLDAALADYVDDGREGIVVARLKEMADV